MRWDRPLQQGAVQEFIDDCNLKTGLDSAFMNLYGKRGIPIFVYAHPPIFSYSTTKDREFITYPLTRWELRINDHVHV